MDAIHRPSPPLHPWMPSTASPLPSLSRPPTGPPSRQAKMKCEKCSDYNKGVKQGKCSVCGHTNTCFRRTARRRGWGVVWPVGVATGIRCLEARYNTTSDEKL